MVEKWMEKKPESKDRGDGKIENRDRRSVAFVRDFGAQGALVASAPPDKSPRSSIFLLGVMTPLTPL
jgi:hypothetical protein